MFQELNEGLCGCRAVTQEEKSVQSLDLVGSVSVFSFLILMVNECTRAVASGSLKLT